MAVATTHDGREVETDVVCLIEGCDEPVVTHKGATAGYCTKLQLATGKTHRQERMEVLRATTGGPGRKQQHEPLEPRPAKPLSKGLMPVTEAVRLIKMADSVIAKLMIALAWMSMHDEDGAQIAAAVWSNANAD